MGINTEAEDTETLNPRAQSMICKGGGPAVSMSFTGVLLSLGYLSWAADTGKVVNLGLFFKKKNSDKYFT